MTHRRRAVVITAAATSLLACATPALAQTGEVVIDDAVGRLQALIVRVAFVVATLVLSAAGLRYITANGDPGKIETAKTAFKGAAVGYAVTLLASGLMGILRSIVGG